MTQGKQEFREQGGIATMDPSPLRRWIDKETNYWRCGGKTDYGYLHPRLIVI